MKAETPSMIIEGGTQYTSTTRRAEFAVCLCLSVIRVTKISDDDMQKNIIVVAVKMEFK